MDYDPSFLTTPGIDFSYAVATGIRSTTCALFPLSAPPTRIGPSAMFFSACMPGPPGPASNSLGGPDGAVVLRRLRGTCIAGSGPSGALTGRRNGAVRHSRDPSRAVGMAAFTSGGRGHGQTVSGLLALLSMSEGDCRFPLVYISCLIPFRSGFGVHCCDSPYLQLGTNRKYAMQPCF